MAIMGPSSGYFGNRYQPPMQNNMGGGLMAGGKPQPPPTPGSAYTASIGQTGEDYSNIMKRFQDIADKSGSQNAGLMSKFEGMFNTPGSTYTPYTPENFDYKRSDEMGSALSNLGELSKTGGYSEEDISNLRARGISPIRSVYASAQRNLDRNRAISGGYSPNYGAASAKMAREMSDKIAGATQDVNAGIAENVAAGKRSMAPQFAAAASGESELANKFGAGNIEARNRAAEINQQMKLKTDELNRSGKLAALEGMRGLQGQETGINLDALKGMLSLYGTTPALAETFGRQALSQAQLEQNTPRRTTGGGASAGLINNYMRNRSGRVSTSRGMFG